MIATTVWLTGVRVYRTLTARDHIDTRRHHRGGMDQGRYRCRTRHRIGQPGIQGICADFPVAPTNNNKVTIVMNPAEAVGACLKYFFEVNRAELVDQREDGDQETEVPDPVHDKGFFRRIAVVEILKPVADQQVRAETHAFPADKEDHEVGAQHQQQHGKNKEVEVREIFCKVRRVFLVHIRRGIQMDQETHAGDDEQK